MRFHPSTLFGAIFMAFAAVPTYVHALSMDALETNSALGQQFSGKVLLRGSADYTPNVACVKVSAADSDLPGPGPMRVTVNPSSEGWVIYLRSVYAVNEPAFQFRLTFDCNDELFSREYSVLLDLPTDTVRSGSEADSGSSASSGAAVPVAGETASRPVGAATPRARPKGQRSPRKATTRRRAATGQGSTVSAPAAIAAAPAAGPARDAVKLAVVPAGASAAAKREAELLALAEDQAAQLRQMEQRITELQAVIARMQPYVPAEDAARLQVPGAAKGSPAPAGTASAAIASARAAIAASGAVASAPAASPVAASASGSVASAPAASAEVASAPAGQGVFDWMFWVWVAAAGLGITAFMTYVLRQKRAEKTAAWGNEVTEELLDSYAPVRRAELLARLNAEGDGARPAAPMVPGMEVIEEEAPPLAAEPGPAPAPAPAVTAAPRPAATEFVEVQQPSGALEEAQWLMAHGEGERAISLLREEIRNHPDHTDLWLALFECLYEQKKNLEFVTLAHRFRRQATGSEAWKRVCDLGLKLDPENRLFLSRNL